MSSGAKEQIPHGKGRSRQDSFLVTSLFWLYVVLPLQPSILGLLGSLGYLYKCRAEYLTDAAHRLFV
jgi:hypothetical protein